MTVINAVHSFRLSTTQFDKKTYLTYLKGYMKAVKAHLAENKPERVEAFEKGAAAYAKKIGEQLKACRREGTAMLITLCCAVANFKDYEFYTGESMNPDGMVVLLNYREDGTTPYLTLCALISAA